MLPLQPLTVKPVLSFIHLIRTDSNELFLMAEKDKDHYSILNIYMEFRKMVTITLYAKQKKTQMYRTEFWTLWEKVRVGYFERTASKHVYYLG